MDINAARKDGYSDEEIMQELASRHKMDVKAALKDGYSKPEIFKELIKRDSSSSKVTNPPTDQKLISSEPRTPEWAGKYPNLYGLYGAGRELYKTVGKPAIETAGMVGGGIVGAGSGILAGAGLGAIPGAAAGAGLGYAGARNLTGVIDSALEVERGDRATLPKVAKSTVKDIALGSVGAGVPGKTPLQQQLANVKRIGTPVSEEALVSTGIKLTPGEQTGGKTLAQV
jgi:hypothetical protein